MVVKTAGHYLACWVRKTVVGRYIACIYIVRATSKGPLGAMCYKFYIYIPLPFLSVPPFIYPPINIDIPLGRVSSVVELPNGQSDAVRQSGAYSQPHISDYDRLEPRRDQLMQHQTDSAEQTEAVTSKPKRWPCCSVM